MTAEAFAASTPQGSQEVTFKVWKLSKSHLTDTAYSSTKVMGEKEPSFSPVQIDLVSQHAHRDPQELTIPAWTTAKFLFATRFCELSAQTRGS